MASIRPFRAVRPAVDQAAAVAALPYDVYHREEAAVFVEKHPDSFLAIDRPETQFGPFQDMYADCVYEKAAEMLAGWEARGIFEQDPEACYYLYELTMDGRSQTGLVAVSSVSDYENGVIRRHENTRKDKEQDRIRHVDTCSAQTGPIFLAYRGSDAVRSLICGAKAAEPDADFVSDDGVRHRTWRISDPDMIRQITEAFAQVPNTYIADGHHRAASAVAVSRMRRAAHPGYTGEEEFNYFLSVLFPDDELQIMAYNRVLKDLNGHTPKELLYRIGKVCGIEPSDSQVSPSKKGEMGMILDDKWYRLTVRPERCLTDPVGSLDIEFLQREILGPIWRIGDPRTDDRIDFVGGIRGLSELERRCEKDCSAAFAMYPTSMEELLTVADAGLLMPPKSTWFEPKLRSGLFIHKIEK